MKFSKSVKHACLVLVAAFALTLTAAPAVSAHSNYQAPKTAAVKPQTNVNQSTNSQRAQYHKTLAVAKSKLGHRYVYGAVGPKHFDCSGFTKYVYRRGAHISLPRTAQAQYSAFEHKHHARRGELAFFGYGKHDISHVGMCISHSEMIDAQNRGVVTEKIHAPWWHLVGYSDPFNR